MTGEQMDELFEDEPPTAGVQRRVPVSTEARLSSATHRTKTGRQGKKRHMSESEEEPPIKQALRRSKRLDPSFSFDTREEPLDSADSNTDTSDDEDDEELLPEDVKYEEHIGAVKQDISQANAFPLAKKQARKNHPTNSSNCIDLTAEADTISPSAYKTSKDCSSNAPGQLKGNAAAVCNETDDEEDMEDELRQIELRRKLRAIRKQKAKAVKNET